MENFFVRVDDCGAGIELSTILSPSSEPKLTSEKAHGEKEKAMPSGLFFYLEYQGYGSSTSNTLSLNPTVLCTEGVPGTGTAVATVLASYVVERLQAS